MLNLFFNQIPILLAFLLLPDASNFLLPLKDYEDEPRKYSESQFLLL